jgi:formylglycine-generating enzyme required for sulfatase activity
MTDTKKSRDDDYLEYGVYADTLWKRIETALNKDADGKIPLGDDPLVVGIFGEWGAGKSKLLRLVQDRAELRLASQRLSNDPSFHRTVPVYFQPWKYEHEQHLHVPLVMHIAQALKDALKQEPGLVAELTKGATEVATKAAAPVAVAEKTLKVARALFKPLKIIVESFSVFGFSLKIPDELGEFLNDGIEAMENAKDGVDGETKKRKEEQDARAKRQITYSNEGLYFYRINEFLRKLTRPAIDEVAAKDVGASHLNEHARINFVIFIDDLDRCLPEKAVETLELIKTVFNLESFAFVLALDEEVVERGIGHRYKDYALAGKKPEMPITGFEYLEKIVHLPFRLPALTKVQALDFIKKYESDLLASKIAALPAGEAKERAQNSKAWFVERTEHSKTQALSGLDVNESTETFAENEPKGMCSAGMGGRESSLQYKLHLGQFVVNCFDAYVPRKLIRIVELFHQLLDVLEQRIPEGSTNRRVEEVRLGGAIDPRTLMAFIMLQLFQPELYRTLRRSGTGFDSLRKAFEPDSSNTATAKELTAQISDSDLLHWAVYWVGDSSPTSVKSAHLRVPALGDVGRKHQAQRLRLPIVERILEHRAVNRHAFDPLKLFAELRLMETNNAPHFKLPDQNDHLYAVLVACEAVDPIDAKRVEPLSVSLLAEKVEQRNAGTNPLAQVAGADWRTAVEINNLTALYQALVDPEEPNQKLAPSGAGLELGQVLGRETAAKLRADCEKFFLQKPQSGAEDDSAFKERRYRLLRGLQYLAPYISRDEGPKFWELVKDALPVAEQDFSKVVDDLDMLKRREMWADVRSTLGADDRFDGEKRYGEVKEGEKITQPGVALWLPKAKHNGNSDGNEPITGFVRVKAGTMLLTGKSDKELPVRKIAVENDFFIARTLTTVDQYAAFVAADGYENDDWWDNQGIDWRRGKDSKIEDKLHLAHLKKRTVEMRAQPMRWDKQRAHGARAVWGVNWFEARAYARWLDAQIGPEVLKKLNVSNAQSFAGSRYRVMLPTEAQWERAARAQDHAVADAREFPWAESKKEPHLQANIRKSEIWRASVVGLFPPNSLGASDLAGNLWEWQNGVYLEPGRYHVGEPIPKINRQSGWLFSGKDFISSDCPALRGGSWYFNSDYARVAFRNRYRPDDSNDFIGFRVVISLARNEP